MKKKKDLKFKKGELLKGLVSDSIYLVLKNSFGKERLEVYSFKHGTRTVFIHGDKYLLEKIKNTKD